MAAALSTLVLDFLVSSTPNGEPVTAGQPPC
jgi:hypothetical protein